MFFLTSSVVEAEGQEAHGSRACVSAAAAAGDGTSPPAPVRSNGPEQSSQGVRFTFCVGKL